MLSFKAGYDRELTYVCGLPVLCKKRKPYSVLERVRGEKPLKTDGVEEICLIHIGDTVADRAIMFRNRRFHCNITSMRRLDAIDRSILRELQHDGRITNVELARRVGISAPPCLRRVRSLEEAGYIKGYRALLDEKALGCEVTAFAMVHLTSQAEADLEAFEAFVRREPLVRECWMLSGEVDFVLKCVAPNLSRFQAFVTDLTAAPHVRNVKTSLTLRNSKDAPMVPVELLRARSPD